MWDVVQISAHVLEPCPPKHCKAPKYTLMISYIMLFSRSQQGKFLLWHYKAETQFCSLLQRRPFIVPFFHETLSIFCCFQHYLSTAVLQHSLSKVFLEAKWRQCTYRNVIHCFIKAGPWFWIVLHSFTDCVFSYTPEHMKLIL